jgi:hypothetical protein
MKQSDAKTLYIVVTFIIALVLLTPLLSQIVQISRGESFSEIWLLGDGDKAENYPLNLSQGETYNVRLGVRNNKGSLAYYLVYLKMLNRTDPIPNSTQIEPSQTPPTWEWQLTLADGQDISLPVSLTLSDVRFVDSTCRIGGLLIGDKAVRLEKNIQRDSVDNGYFLRILFELWIHDRATDSFEYDNRFVYSWVSITQLTP